MNRNPMREMRGPSLNIAVVACLLMAPAAAAADASEWHRSQRATLTLPADAAGTAGVAESVLVAQGVASPSPCEDEMYRKLKAKDVGQMTPREYETFLRKEDACTNSRPPPAKEVGPCEDALYLGLKSKDLNRMSAREYETFKQKDGLCDEYQRLQFSGVVPSATPGLKSARPQKESAPREKPLEAVAAEAFEGAESRALWGQAGPGPARAGQRSPATFATNYAKEGSIEAGGAIAFSSSSSKLKDGPTTSSTDIDLEPTFGYFAVDNVELLGTLLIGMSNEKVSGGGGKASSTTMGLALGGAYMVPVNTMFMGPQLQLGYASTNFTGALEGTVTSAPLIHVGGVAKLPVGASALVSFDLGYTHQTVTADPKGGPSIDGTVSGFGLDVGLSLHF